MRLLANQDDKGSPREPFASNAFTTTCTTQYQSVNSPQAELQCTQDREYIQQQAQER